MSPQTNKKNACMCVDFKLLLFNIHRSYILGELNLEVKTTLCHMFIAN